MAATEIGISERGECPEAPVDGRDARLILRVARHVAGQRIEEAVVGEKLPHPLGQEAAKLAIVWAALPLASWSAAVLRCDNAMRAPHVSHESGRSARRASGGMPTVPRSPRRSDTDSDS